MRQRNCGAVRSRLWVDRPLFLGLDLPRASKRGAHRAVVASGPVERAAMNRFDPHIPISPAHISAGLLSSPPVKHLERHRTPSAQEVHALSGRL